MLKKHIFRVINRQYVQYIELREQLKLSKIFNLNDIRKH